jgi:acyl carrier protein
MERDPGQNDEEGEQDELFEEFKDLAAGVLEVDRSRILPDSTFADLDADSLDVVELTMAAEERYDMTIPEQDLEGMKTTGDFFKYLKNRLANKPDEES